MFKWFMAVPPPIGSKWYLNDDNPFDEFVVMVLAIKRGWVKYKFRHGSESSLSIRSFRSIYREIPGSTDVVGWGFK